MFKSLLMGVVLLCAANIAMAQSAIGMELRVLIGVELDTAVQVVDGEVEKGVKLVHPFADQKALNENFYVVTQTRSKAYIKETDYTIVPIL